MIQLKDIGRIVPAGYYVDAAYRQKAFYDWISNSLTPFLGFLEKSLIDEFRLGQNMYKYDVNINGAWFNNLSSTDLVESLVKKTVNNSGCEDFQLQLVIECSHPNVVWGTTLDIVLSNDEITFNEEEFICHFIVIEPVRINLDETLSLFIAQQLVEAILIELRINYVQNS